MSTASPAAAMPAHRSLRTRRGLLWVAAVLAATGGPAAAHPHVFVDTGIELVFDAQGDLAAVQVVWVFDEFYSMMSMADFGLDADFTGSVTAAEQAELTAIYSNWVPGFEGDLYPLRAGRPLALSGPLDILADYREGRIIVTHRRAFQPRIAVGAEPVVVQVYDPTYYTEYTIAAEPVIRGRDDCSATVYGPDWEAANERLMAALDELMGGGGDIEADFPAIGAEFAEEVRVTCAESS